jgi:hypothetical protein
MKKLFAIIGIMIALQASSNPVTFCVDMRYWTIDPGGIHLYIVGDTVFHPMTQSIIDTNIYCLTLDLPSDSCIEYDFLNGSDFYGLEFVPPESRVDDINSNRWICTHGTTTDTLETGALLFAANAPEGQSMLRLKVDMVQQSSVDLLELISVWTIYFTETCMTPRFMCSPALMITVSITAAHQKAFRPLAV